MQNMHIMDLHVFKYLHIFYIKFSLNEIFYPEITIDSYALIRYNTQNTKFPVYLLCIFLRW